MKMSCEQFAKEIVTSQDLDPDYYFLSQVFKKLNLSDEERARWIVLKTVVYNSCSEAEIFFSLRSFEDVEYGAERRKHKRYAQRFYDSFKNHAIGRSASVARFFKHLNTDATYSLQALQKIDGVGPWASWKCLDLCERVLDIPINFTTVDFRVAYEYPLKGILMLSDITEDVKLLQSDLIYQKCLNSAVIQIGKARELMAPPSRNRRLNLQEYETIFCKYHSYLHGHYEPGEDLARLRKRITSSPFEPVRSLQDCLP